MEEFVQLHNHSDYSLLDGMLRISENHKPSQFLRGLAQQGITAMGLTDHGNMYGALDFYESATAVGLKPLVGCEFYVTEGKYNVKDKSLTGHLTLLARNHEGYLNLMKLNSIPRILNVVPIYLDKSILRVLHFFHAFQKS